jgi:hypothetical protein
MIIKRWIEYRYVICPTPIPTRDWHLDERSVMDVQFQPVASRLVEKAIAEGQFIAYVLVNCDSGGIPLILESHNDLANRMFKVRLPGARLTG